MKDRKNEIYEQKGNRKRGKKQRKDKNGKEE